MALEKRRRRFSPASQAFTWMENRYLSPFPAFGTLFLAFACKIESRCRVDRFLETGSLKHFKYGMRWGFYGSYLHTFPSSKKEIPVSTSSALHDFLLF